METEDKIKEYRLMFDIWNSVRQSAFGVSLQKQLKQIKDQAISQGYRGKTPQSANEYLESRGAYKAALKIERFIKDIEDNNKKAIKWMDENYPTNDAIAKGK